MDIVNQMIEEGKNPVTAEQTNTNPNDILNNMAADAQKEKSAEETASAEEAARLAAEAKANAEQKDADALKLKEKQENKEIVLDDKKQPVLDELGDKVKKTDEPVEKEWYVKEETPVDGAPEPKNQDEAKQKIVSEKLARLSELEKTFADPEIEAFIAAKKSGKGIKEFYNEVMGVDYDGLTPEALQEIKLKSLGVEGEDLAEALEAFSSLPKWDKVERTSALKAELKSKQSENLKKFSVDAKAQEQLHKESIKKQVKEAEDYSKQLVGQKKFGIEITPEIAFGVKQGIIEGVKDFIKEDGTLNIANYSDAVILYQNREAIVAANVKKALNKGKGEILADVTRANKNETVNRVPDEQEGKKTEYDKVGKDFFGQYATKQSN